MNRLVAISIIMMCPVLLGAAEPQAPTNVRELFEGFDPRKEPLDIKVVREWTKDEMVIRYVTFHIGSFKGTPARMAGFYAFPRNAKKLPALLHLHGGGQRAFLHEVEFYAQRGYVCLSINWGGREMEGAKEGDANTDWGAVDPTQQNVPGYFNMKPGPKYLDPIESPRNNNWYLLTLAARRGLTFLEQQAEVDPARLGVYGHSMGGNLTVYVAGSDDRVKAASPSVGGSGFRTQPIPLIPQSRPQLPNGDVKRFDATLGFESYAPLIQAPVLWLGSTNDFHGVMDDTYRTGQLIPHQQVRYVFTPHMNHRFTPEYAVTRALWFDEHLKGAFRFPKTPASRMIFTTSDHVPAIEVRPDAIDQVKEVNIYYSIDADPRARFWRSTDSKRMGDTWSASLPIMRADQPLYVFANVIYAMPKSPSEPYAKPTDRFALSSVMHTVKPDELKANGVITTDQRSPLIEDFRHGWRDWYSLSAENPHHWEYSTRKLTDPKWRGDVGQHLRIEVQSQQPNELVIVLTEHFFRSYRGKQREYVAVVKLEGGRNTQSIRLNPGDFRSSENEPLTGWKGVDLLSFRAYYDKGAKIIGSKSWAGPQPTFQKLEWVEPGE